MNKKIKILTYSTRSYDKLSFREQLVKHPGITMDFTESALNLQSVTMAKDYDAVCIFVNDSCDRAILEQLKNLGIKLVLLRCAGTNNVDLNAAKDFGIMVRNVPAYSPESIAEHALALLMAVNRRICRAYNRIRDNNFSLTGLSGYCLHGKTVGIIGYGRIGKGFANICLGMGMKVLAYDPAVTNLGTYNIYGKNQLETVTFVTLDELYEKADVISLHVPLLDSTKHMINDEAIAKMKKDVILINASRGGLIDNEALIRGIKAKKFFGVGLDVYEGEDENVYTNHEDDILMNCITSRLTSFPNVVVTSHQAFLTDVALEEIAKQTLENALELFPHE